jgi:hypothetical protein
MLQPGAGSPLAEADGLTADRDDLAVRYPGREARGRAARAWQRRGKFWAMQPDAWEDGLVVSPGSTPPSAVSRTTPFVELCGALAVAVPFAVIATGVSGLTSWRTDEAVVRTLGFGLAGGEGMVSAILGQVFMFVPVGSRVMRAGWVGAVGAALAAWAIYAIALGLLRGVQRSARLAPALGLAAAWIATLGPSWRVEATTPGGAALAAALVLGGIARLGRGPLGAPGWALLGVLVALAAAESHAAGLALLGAITVASLSAGALPRGREVAWFAALVAWALAVVFAPVLVATLGPEGALGLGPDPLTTRLGGLAASVERRGPLEGWLAEVGFVACGLASAGAALGLVRRSTRPVMAALVGLVLLDAAFPAVREATLVSDPLGPLHLLSPAALGIATVVAVHAAAAVLLAARVRFAETAAVLLVVFTATLVLVTVDRAAPSGSEVSASPAEVWTDEALHELPAHSLVLVRSAAVAQRLWAARLATGARPDVVVVPVPWLDRGALASHLLHLEPALGPLIRELAVRGEPSEYALSALADRRPLFVEVDAAWDVRLVEHLVPRSLWLGFAPHALGRYDRNAAYADARLALQRVLREARRGPHPDEATLAMLGGRARQHAIALAALGDRDSLDVALKDLRAIDPGHPFIAEIEQRLRASGRGRVDVRGLE